MSKWNKNVKQIKSCKHFQRGWAPVEKNWSSLLPCLVSLLAKGFVGLRGQCGHPMLLLGVAFYCKKWEIRTTPSSPTFLLLTDKKWLHFSNWKLHSMQILTATSSSSSEVFGLNIPPSLCHCVLNAEYLGNNRRKNNRESKIKKLHGK